MINPNIPAFPQHPEVTGPEQIQKIEHAKRLLKVRLDLIHAERQRLLDEQNQLWESMQKLDSALAAVVNGHLVDA